MPSMLSLFSRSHHRSPATSPALLFLVATSLSSSAIRPPSQFSLSSCSHRRPTATTLPPPLSSPHPTSLSLCLGIADCRCLLSLTSTVGFCLRRGRYRCRLLSLSLSFAALPSPPGRPFVGDLGVHKNLHDFEARRPQAPHLRSFVPSLFSPSASAPSSLIDATAMASFTAASPPPTKTSSRCHLPSSTESWIL